MKRADLKGLLPIIVSLLILLVLVSGCKPRESPLAQNTETNPSTTPEQTTPSDTSQPVQPKKVDENVPASQIITATVSEWTMKLDKSVVKTGKIKFIVTNDGPKFPHSLIVADKSTGKAASGLVGVNVDEVDTLVADLTPGTYEVYSPHRGDKLKGVTTTLTVTA